MPQIIVLWTVLLSVMYSCNIKEEASENAISNHSDSIQVSDSIIKKRFLTALRQQPIQQLPFSFAPNLLDSLHDKSAYEKLIFKLAHHIADGASLMNDLNVGVNHIMSSKNFNDSSSYHDYLRGDNFTFSRSCVYKRLPISVDSTETLLTVSYQEDKQINSIKGLNFEVITVNGNTGELICRELILSCGMGLNNIFHYGGFEIDKNNYVNIKEYKNFEDEFYQLESELNITRGGLIQRMRSEMEVLAPNYPYNMDQFSGTFKNKCNANGNVDIRRRSAQIGNENAFSFNAKMAADERSKNGFFLHYYFNTSIVPTELINWSNLSKDSAIAYVKILSYEKIEFQWFGFYNDSTKLREGLYPNGHELFSSTPIRLKKCVTSY